ncbi:hypothetical protein M0804_009298 [Polistes exclamans]|nr:hypothetical protein M0804_009298 [Polistes exclamans]
MVQRGGSHASDINEKRVAKLGSRMRKAQKGCRGNRQTHPVRSGIREWVISLFCSTNLGTAIRASVYIRLLNLARDYDRFHQIAVIYGLKGQLLQNLFRYLIFLLRETLFKQYEKERMRNSMQEEEEEEDEEDEDD